MADKRRQRRDFCHLHNRERRINECWVLSNHWKYRMVPPQWCLLVYKPHYPLVMTNITMERSTMLLMGKSTISIGSFSIANCWHHQRVTDEATQKVSWFASRMATSRNIGSWFFFYHGWTKKFIDDGWSTHNLHFFDGKNPFLVGYLICSMVMSNKANTLNHPLIFFWFHIWYAFYGPMSNKANTLSPVTMIPTPGFLNMMKLSNDHIRIIIIIIILIYI